MWFLVFLYLLITMERLPELPLEPEYWPGSDEWAELADARRHINEQYQEYLHEDDYDN